MRVGHEVLSITTGRRSPRDKDTWWWNDKVQEVIKAKERVNEDVGNISKANSYRQANKEGKQGCNESSSTAMGDGTRSWKHRSVKERVTKERYLG